ncbi:MAG: hypothetical protein GQ564_17840 [Bacteroidales bacterium]|nr:hypothetical protein [Bacteroidales bacterium]
MRSTFFTFIAILIISKSLFSQDYAKVDTIVQNYSNSFSSPDKLAKQINRDFTLSEEKARAIYTWIALNVEYDIELLKSKPKKTSFSYRTQEEKLEKERKIIEDVANKTIRKKKAICHGYSTLYKYLCDLVSVDCEYISGGAISKKQDIGKLPKKNGHAWNAVKIKNEWKLIDVTWGAGYANENSTRFTPEFNDFYFFTSPEKFFLNHYPKDTAFLIVDKSPIDFANLPYFNTNYFHWNIEIIEPKTGTIDLTHNDSIKIILRNPQKESISMKFKNKKKSETVLANIENEFYTFEIEYKKSSNTYLTIYINSEAIVTFKIKRI